MNSMASCPQIVGFSGDGFCANGPVFHRGSTRLPMSPARVSLSLPPLRATGLSAKEGIKHRASVQAVTGVTYVKDLCV